MRIYRNPLPIILLCLIGCGAVDKPPDEKNKFYEEHLLNNSLVHGTTVLVILNYEGKKHVFIKSEYEHGVALARVGEYPIEVEKSHKKQ